MSTTARNTQHIMYYLCLMIVGSSGVIQLFYRTKYNTFPNKWEDEASIEEEQEIFFLNGIAILMAICVILSKIVMQLSVESMYFLWLHHALIGLPYIVMFSDTNTMALCIATVFYLTCFMNMINESALYREREIFYLKLRNPVIITNNPSKMEAADIKQNDSSSSTDTSYSEVCLENVTDYTTDHLSSTFHVWPLSNSLIAFIGSVSGVTLPIFFLSYPNAPTHVRRMMVMFTIYYTSIHCIYMIISRMPSDSSYRNCNVSRNMLGISSTVILSVMIAIGTGMCLVTTNLI